MRPTVRRLVPALVLSLLTACAPPSGDTLDACAIATTGSVTGGSVDAAANTLDCNPVGGSPCTGDVTLERQACSDGFGFVLARGGTLVGLRLKSDGSAWSFGAGLGDGSALNGSLTIQGMVPPGEPVPPAGKLQKATFALSSSAGTFTGTVNTTW